MGTEDRGGARLETLVSQPQGSKELCGRYLYPWLEPGATDLLVGRWW